MEKFGDSYSLLWNDIAQNKYNQKIVANCSLRPAEQYQNRQK